MESPRLDPASDPHARRTGKLSTRDDSSSNCPHCLALQAEVARLQEMNAALRMEVEHWVGRYNTLELWRADTSVLHLKAEAEVARLTQEQEKVRDIVTCLKAMSPYTGNYHCVFCKANALLRHDDECIWELAQDFDADPPAALASLPQEGTKE
jgi:hypothetical protein